MTALQTVVPMDVQMLVSVVDEGPKEIDEIIDNLNHTSIYLAEWDEHSGEVCLTLYAGFIGSDHLPELPIRWEVGSCYVWYDMDNELYPIYRGDDPSPPKNDRWEVHKGMCLHLYFKSGDVGIPTRWTKRMRRRHARGRHQTDQ